MFKISLYFHTLKYLKFSQIYHRILKRFQHPKVNDIQVKCPSGNNSWSTQRLYSQKFLTDTEVGFLNHKGSVESARDWNDEKEEKLWLYNLHYFDDLNSFGSDSRNKLQIKWINKWVDENPAKSLGNGWEPYTLSLRIVNWTKAFLSGLEVNEKILNSLAQQADFLSQDLEKHLLGNHYFVNLKALMFAGCYLKGKDANKWLKIALKDYEKELCEQVLDDGGSFELTPMYHAIMLTDLLDLYNLFISFPSKVPQNKVDLTKRTIIKMFQWLNHMSLGDGKISFFNDSAFGVSPESDVLREYAGKLGINIDKDLTPEKLLVHNLKSSGYVSVKTSEMNLIADLSQVGPSYIPGHAHADTLTFELSLGQSRIFVNSGTSEYGMSDERLRQRGTSAHNTVEINAKNSSEVWSGFRVARRADIDNRVVGDVNSEQTVKFSASHNGYKKQGINCTHSRQWFVSSNFIEITDTLDGLFDSAQGHLHLHPDIKVISCNGNQCILNSHEHFIEIEVFGADMHIIDTTWHPEFGVVIPSQKLALAYRESNVIYRINWKTL
jgi:uncharacterized heparinase superfamily protein